MSRCSQIALAILFLFLPLVGRAQSNNIYLIKAFDCGPKHSQRSQTGFRLQDLPGIITALHGVADSPRIMAQSDSGGIAWRNLKIVKVDVEHDLALLSSDDLKKQPAVGLTAIPATWNSLTKVRVFGHPFGIAELTTDLTVRQPPIRILHDLVPNTLPDTLLNKLQQRKSPDPDKEVVSLDGAILPGDSGAPILDLSKHVVAIADGGLQIGSNICWAIPFQDIHWSESSDALLLELQKLNTAGVLFDVEDYVPPTFPITTSRHDTGEDTIGDGHHMTTDVTITADGHLTAVTKIENKVTLNGFCGKVAVFLLDKDGNVMKSVGPGSQYCVGSVVESQFGGADSKRTEQWTADIPADILCKINSVSIVHTPGQKNPFDLLQDNVTRIRKIKDNVKLD